MFISEDLPTFDLPIKANSGNFCFGFSDILVLLPENSASEIFITVGKGKKSFSHFINKMGLCRNENYYKFVSVERM